MISIHDRTGLHWAASQGYEDIMEDLIQAANLGAPESTLTKKFVNAQDFITGWTALHVSSIFELIFPSLHCLLLIELEDCRCCFLPKFTDDHSNLTIITLFRSLVLKATINALMC
jgi:hypothetical protein